VWSTSGDEEGTHSGKNTIRLLGISAERPTNGLYLLPLPEFHLGQEDTKKTIK
jgi:hypothetical protein